MADNELTGSEVTGSDTDATLDSFAAELTVAAYRVALRRGCEDPWIELEIALWRAMTDTVERWRHRLPPGLPQPEPLDGEPQDQIADWRESRRFSPK